MTSNIKILEQYGTIRRGVSLQLSALTRDLPLGPRQVSIIRILSRYGEMNLSTLALYSGTDPATITRSLQHMTDEGLVEKVQSPEDGRHWLVRLTKKGQKQYPEIQKAYEKLADVFTAALTTEEREHFALLLEKVGTYLEQKI